MCIKCALAWKSIPDGTQIAAVQTLPLTPANHPPSLALVLSFSLHINTHTHRTKSACTQTHKAQRGVNMRSHRHQKQIQKEEIPARQRGLLTPNNTGLRRCDIRRWFSFSPAELRQFWQLTMRNSNLCQTIHMWMLGFLFAFLFFFFLTPNYR